MTEKSSDRGGRPSNALAIVPVAIAIVFMLLVVPRSAPPDLLPLPNVDARLLDRAIAADHARAKAARAEPLPAAVRALGSAIRDFDVLEANVEDNAKLVAARTEIDHARPAAFEVGGVEGLLRLRAVQLEAFLAEVTHFEATAEESPELTALGGTFIARMARVGWVRAHEVLLSDGERRSAFKLTWNKVAGLDAMPEMALSLDETRALYGLYFTHPHAPEKQREALSSARRTAKDASACARIDEGERIAAEGWLLTKVKEYGALDPSYPLGFARGVVLYRRGEFEAAADSFEGWLRDHPDGPWTLRARNHLRAARSAQASL